MARRRALYDSAGSTHAASGGSRGAPSDAASASAEPGQRLFQELAQWRLLRHFAQAGDRPLGFPGSVAHVRERAQKAAPSIAVHGWLPHGPRPVALGDEQLALELEHE